MIELHGGTVALESKLGAGGHGDGVFSARAYLATIARLRADWLADYEAEFADDSAPINGYRMFRELWSVLDPDETILTHESGVSRDIQCVFYQAGGPRSYLG